MVKCLIVDDDAASRKMFEQLISQITSWKVVSSCTNAMEARNVLQHSDVDVLFLDVEMPDISGLELLKIIKVQPEVVIISSKEKYAIDAFEYEVTDYLLKPPTRDRFMKTVERIERRLESDNENYTDNESVFVKANNQISSIQLRDIKYIEAYGDYVNIYAGADRLVVHGTMKGMENKLPADQFIRVHRSFIVRLDKINSIDDPLIVIDKKLIPIGDSYKAELMGRLKFL